MCGNGQLLDYVEKQIALISGMEIEGVIRDKNELKEYGKCSDGTIFLCVSWHEIRTWLGEIEQTGAKEIYRVPVFVWQYELPIYDKDRDVIINCAKVSNDKSDLLYVETHLADICNLKCKGCMHFSNLATEPNFPSLDSFENDFRKLAELFSNIFIIRLMGGEPLLNPQAGEYVQIVRKYFPAAELRIVTNGLLIPQQNQDLWRVFRECHVAMDISPYPPTIDRIDELTAILENEQIPYGKIADRLTHFRKSLTLHGDHSPEKAVQLCQSSHCHFLRDGKISKCPLPLLIDDFNRAYGKSLPTGCDIYDIYCEDSGTALAEKLDRFVTLCNFCPDEAAFIEWSRTSHEAAMEDWVVETKTVCMGTVE